MRRLCVASGELLLLSTLSLFIYQASLWSHMSSTTHAGVPAHGLEALAAERCVQARASCFAHKTKEQTIAIQKVTNQIEESYPRPTR